MAVYKILALDGGGLRGLISARILQRLYHCPEIAGWLDQVDLIAGTSTGSLLGLGLASGKKPQEICDIYLNSGKLIFTRNRWTDYCNPKQLFEVLFGAKYINRELEKQVNLTFGELTLGELQKKVVVPSFQLDNEKPNDRRSWKPKIFNNFQAKDFDYKLAKVALYSTAAPSYFPSVDGFIDGGVCANNPSIVALTQALNAGECDLSDVVLLSIGTGENPEYIEKKVLNWGALRWASPLITILMEGVSDISHYQAKHLLKKHYHRMQVILDPKENIAMDASDKIGRMDILGREYNIAESIDWIQQYWLNQ